MLSQNDKDKLQLISNWLVQNLSTTDFMTVYARTRGSAMVDSLKG